MAEVSGWRLGVDVGAGTVVAVMVGPDGSWRSVLFDGVAELDAAVFRGDDDGLLTGAAAVRAAAAGSGGWIGLPWRHVLDERVEIDGAVVGGLDAAVALLRRVAVEVSTGVAAASVDTVLVVPTGWGPRRRTAVRRAARRAGLGEVSVVDAAPAVARYAQADVDLGGWVVVLDVAGGGEASVLSRTSAGLQVASTVDCPGQARRAEEMLAGRLVEVAARAGGLDAAAVESIDRRAVAGAAATVLRAWSGPVVVSLPAPLPPVLVSSAEVHAAVEPAVAGAVAAAGQAVEAAELPAQRCAGVVVLAPAALAAAVSVGLSQTFGRPVWPVEEAGMARVLGGLEVTATSGRAGEDVRVAAAPSVWQVVELLVAGLAALLLLVHAMITAAVEPGVGLPGGINYFLVGWGELAVAAGLVMVAVVCAASVITCVLAADPPPAPGTAVVAARRYAVGLVASAGAGLATAAMFGLLAAATLGLPSGPFLRWTLIPAAPIAAGALVGAVVAWRHGARGGWWAWFRFPPASAAAAAAGMILVQVAGGLPRGALTGVLAHRFGGLLVGIGAALLLADRRGFQLPLMVVVGLFTALIAGSSTSGIVASIYCAAVVAWIGRALWRHGWLPHLADAVTSTAPAAGPAMSGS